MKHGTWIVFLLAAASLSACARTEQQSAETQETSRATPEAQVVVIKEYPLDNMEGVITQTGVAVDAANSSDGTGSLVIKADGPTTVRLFETGDLDVENARILYKAKLRTEGVEGKAYLEMLCSFPGLGEAFSRALQSPLSGTTEWTSMETPFFLKAGENPDNVKLNLVIDGKGTVWIDQIRLEKGPLGV